MSDIFGIAKSGLQAYKEGLATTGQNIANVGNENYARREVNLTEIKSATSDVLSISSSKNYGVKVDGIVRAFDQFIDVQLQKASSGLSFSTSQTLILEKLEQVLRPGEKTVANKFQDFFASLRESYIPTYSKELILENASKPIFLSFPPKTRYKFCLYFITTKS